MKSDMKISDSLDEIDVSLLDNIQTDYKVNPGVSVDKIKNLVMQNISETNPVKVSYSKPRKIRLGILVPAAVLIIIMTFTAYAVQNSQAFEIFFADAMEFLTGRTQEINLTDSNNGITMHLEAAVNDNKSGVILFSFTKDDGSTFEKNIAVGEITLRGTGGGYGFGRNKTFSNDMKKMSYYIDPRVSGNLSRRKLTLTVQDLIREQTGEKTLDLNLKQLFDTNPIDINLPKNEVIINGSTAETIAATEVKKQNYNIELIPEIISGFKLDGIAFVDGKLRIFTSIPGSNMKYNEDTADIRFLINTKTGEKIYSECRTGTMPSDNDNTTYSQFAFDISDPEALEDLRLVISYTTREVISGRWSVSFRLKGSQLPITKTTDVKIKDNNDTITITKVSVSMIGLYVEGFITSERGERIARNVSLTQSVVLDNGEIVITTMGSNEYDQNRHLFILNYRIDKFIDIEKLRSVIIEGVEIPMK